MKAWLKIHVCSGFNLAAWIGLEIYGCENKKRMLLRVQEMQTFSSEIELLVGSKMVPCVDAYLVEHNKINLDISNMSERAAMIYQQLELSTFGLDAEVIGHDCVVEKKKLMNIDDGIKMPTGVVRIMKTFHVWT